MGVRSCPVSHRQTAQATASVSVLDGAKREVTRRQDASASTLLLVRRSHRSAFVVGNPCFLQEYVERVHTEHEHAAFTRATKDHNLVAFLRSPKLEL